MNATRHSAKAHFNPWQLFTWTLFLLPLATHSQVPSETLPSTTIRVQTQPYVLYELQQSSGSTLNPTWTSIQSWKVGDGSPLQWIVENNNATQASYQVVSQPILDLNPDLTTFVQNTGVPAIGALVIREGKVHAIGAMGTRRVGIAAPVTYSDLWHHGSVTKGMTATLAALMVQEGLIGWQTTLGQVFPDKVPAMAQGWKDVTLKQLLSNTSGAPGSPGTEIWTQWWNHESLPRQARMFVIDTVTPLPLAYTPGQGYEYSNTGFAIAGAMLETVADTDWETLMKTRLFQPLGMTTAGFGVSATPRMLDQPYGHGNTLQELIVYEPGRQADNPPAIGPAATAHASLVDMARYLQFHLRGERNESGLLLQPSSFDVLHTALSDNGYALGWIKHGNGWLSHTGSNTYNFTNVWIDPTGNWACIVCLNYGGSNAFEISDQLVVHLIQNYK